MDKEGSTLPMEKALIPMDDGIRSVLSELRHAGNGELTALWNAHRFAGKGVPFLLMSTLVAAAGKLPLSHLSILVSDYMGPYAVRNGFVPFSGIGVNGKFNYPIPGYESYAMVLRDVRLLEQLSLEDRHRIISLRIRPMQTRIEKPRSVPLEVNYDLRLDQDSSDTMPQAGRKEERFAA